MKHYALALDLKNDPELIAEYKQFHKKIWPEIEMSIKESGIESMKIYLLGNRLFMTIEALDSFSFETKAEMDANNTVVQQWEELMWNYQQALPMAKPGEKWLLMEKIFEL